MLQRADCARGVVIDSVPNRVPVSLQFVAPPGAASPFQIAATAASLVPAPAALRAAPGDGAMAPLRCSATARARVRGAGGQHSQHRHPQGMVLETVCGDGLERSGAGGMQHSGSGAALGRARDAGRGLPAPTPSPAFAINNTNSSSPGPRGQAKGPGGHAVPRGAWATVRGAGAAGKGQGSHSAFDQACTHLRLRFRLVLRGFRRARLLRFSTP